ncbi:MAG: tetratricopeptide repeat protein [Acidiferrobacterales bacterium]
MSKSRTRKAGSARLWSAWVAAACLTLAGDAYTLSPKLNFRSLDGTTQLLKKEVLRVNRDLLILSEALTYPTETRITVSLSIDGNSPVLLDAAELRINDQLIARHRYSEVEAKALLRGGVHRLYTGNLSEGEHDLAVSLKGRTAKGRPYGQSASMIVNKRAGPKRVEMAIVKPLGMRQPELHLPILPRDRSVRHVQDPHFGEVLFEAYQKRYFAAVTKLMSAQTMRRVTRHEYEAALLLADLYRAYGLHRESSRLFARLLKQGVPPDVEARVRFSLAKSWYQRGYLKEAQQTLLRMRQPLSPALQAEQRILLALVLMKRNRYGEGVAVLSQLTGKSEWVTYARYNMGVGLIQIGRIQEGVALLEKIARMRAKDSEMKALRDKANLALGFAFLGVPDPQKAKSYFREVRLSGPFSNKALLGLGWALSARGKHKQSLAPWMELRNRGDIDVAVQESLLAVPYALSNLEAYQQAIEQYENAITVYNAEIERLGHAIETLRSGKLVVGVVADRDISQQLWVVPEELFSDTSENRYLIHVFASHAFQATLKNYRDLLSLSKNLGCWSTAVTATPELARSLASVKQKIAQEATVENVTADNNACGRLNDAAYWQFSSDYEPSLWQTTTANIQSSDEISQPHLATKSAAITDTQNEDLEARIAPLRVRIAQLQTKVGALVRIHEQYLQQQAAQELERQQSRLRAYVTQARFGIAQVYDRSAGHAEQTR